MGNQQTDKPHSFTGLRSKGLFNRLLNARLFMRENLYRLDAAGNRKPIACSNFPMFEGDVLRPTKLDLARQYQILSRQLFFLKYSSSPCLLQAGKAFNQLLTIWLNASPNNMVGSIAASLLDIYAELVSRTKSPYQWQLGITDKLFDPLPTDFLLEGPFDRATVENWKRVKRDLKLILAGNVIAFAPIEIQEATTNSLKEDQFKPETEWAFEKMAAHLDENISSQTPLITSTVRDLKKWTVEVLINKVLTQRKELGKTDAIFIGDAKSQLLSKGAYSLYEFTDIILYHSVYTVILDRDGNPVEFLLGTKICKEAESPILYPTMGIPLDLKRNIPLAATKPPGITYISMGKLADWSFQVQGNTVKQTQMQMVGSFYFSEYTQEGAHPYQLSIQDWLDKHSSKIIASLSSPTAFLRRELTLEAFRNMIPILLAASMPYVFEEMIKRIKEADVKEYLIQAIKDELLSEIKELIIKKITQYLEKKLGERIVPLLNLVMTVKDIIEGEEERRQVRTMVACFRMAIQGGNDDDMTISAKVLSKVLADKFQQQIEARIKAAAKHKLGKIAEKIKSSGTDQNTPGIDTPPVPDYHPEPVGLPDPKSPVAAVPTQKPAIDPHKVKAEYDRAQELLRTMQDAQQNSRNDPAIDQKAIDSAPTTVAGKEAGHDKPALPAVIVRKPTDPDRGPTRIMQHPELAHGSDHDMDEDEATSARKDLEGRGNQAAIDTKDDDDQSGGSKPPLERNKSENPPNVRPKSKFDDDEWDDDLTKRKGITSRGKYPREPFHHLIPREMLKNKKIAALLKKRGIDIEQLTVKIPQSGHEALHRVGYNKEWEDYFEKNPNAKLEDIRDFAEDMRKKYKIEDAEITAYPKPGEDVD